MLSAQCDKLRQMAESVGLAMPQAATLMMEAADTILELRDDLQQANDAVQDAEHDESMAWDRVHKAESEADKLRELVGELYECSRQIGCDKCGYKDGCAMFDRMAQLGVEVDA
jgi:methyl-accepting chemotaxis protein